MGRVLAALLTLVSSLDVAHGAEGVYDIGNIRPEGIFILPADAVELMGLAGGSDDEYALVSEFYYGGIKAVNLQTGQATQIVDSKTVFGERGTIGLWYDDGVILACSGGAFVGESNVAALYVFDAATGQELAMCEPNGGGTFLNDVAVIDGIAYATDSFQNSIMTLDVEAAKTGECVVSAIETPAAIFLSNDTWSANGIVPYGNALLIAHETNGGVYYLDLSNNMFSNLIREGTAVFADGLCIGEDDILYIAQNDEPGPLTAWQLRLEDDFIDVENLGTIMSDDYDSPATCGISGGVVYSPNARFGIGLPAEGEDNLDTFNEKFQVVGVDRLEFSTGAPAQSPVDDTGSPSAPTGAATELPSSSPTGSPSITPTSSSAPPTSSECKTVTTQEGFDLDTYISARWYSQQQRPTPFQPTELFFCTTADYTELDASNADFNEAYSIKVFNTAQDAEGNVFTSDDEGQGPLCGLQQMPDTDPAKLLVGNCLDDPLEPFGSGPYWVLEYDESAGYALISGGQPDIPTKDGLCSYSAPFSGLWIFTRESGRNDTLVKEVRAMAVRQGIDPTILVDVQQVDCTYPEAPTPSPSPSPTDVVTTDVVTLTPKLDGNGEGCIKVNGTGTDRDNFMLATCDTTDVLQQLVFDGELIRLASSREKCMQGGHSNPSPGQGNWLRVFPCDASNPQQQFTWDGPDGALTLVQYPNLAVVFAGVTADVNSDYIILGDLSIPVVANRKDWEVWN